MFRRGGSTNNGIMTGIVDREQKKIGDVAGRARELTPELESLLSVEMKTLHETYSQH